MTDEHYYGFVGDAMIQLEDGSIQSVDTLKKGERVWGGPTIQDIIRIPIEKEIWMVIFETGLTIAPYHPILNHQETDWIVPCDVDYLSKIYVKHLYQLVLDSGHIVNLNGYKVSTLKKLKNNL